MGASWGVLGTSWGLLGASWGVWGRLGAFWRPLGRVLEASWVRRGGILGVLGASWRRLGGEDREMARKSQLKAPKYPFYLDSVTSTLNPHRKTRGGPARIRGRLERNLNFYALDSLSGFWSGSREGFTRPQGGTSPGPRLAKLLAGCSKS